MSEEVDMVASGYEFVCPKCDSLNYMSSAPQEATCYHCDTKVVLGGPNHCYGGAHGFGEEHPSSTLRKMAAMLPKEAKT